MLKGVTLAGAVSRWASAGEAWKRSFVRGHHGVVGRGAETLGDRLHAGLVVAASVSYSMVDVVPHRSRG